MRDKMSRADKKKHTALRVIILVIAVVAAAFAVIRRNAIMRTFNESFPAKTIESLDLTKTQKTEDFEQLYDTIASGFPNADDIRDAYSVDFIGKKSYYLELINNTEDDFQYYCTMSAILEELASAHTVMWFPDYDETASAAGYNINRVLAKRKLMPCSDYWNRLIEKKCSEYKDAAIAEFRYTDGKYRYDLLSSDETYDSLQDSFISSIDGTDIDEYVMDNISVNSIGFDTARNKPFRKAVTLNDSVGEKHEVVLTNDKGESISMELYTSTEIETVSMYSSEFDDHYSPDPPDIYDHYDSDENILYVAVNNFSNNEGSKLRGIFSQADDETAIIIDLRENVGGSTGYASSYIFPYLHDEAYSFSQEWFVPSSKENNKFVRSPLIRFLYHPEKTEGGYNFRSVSNYTDSARQYGGEVYYLIGRKSASAADGYAAMIKENGIADLIGTDTAGEGLGGSFCVSILENSGLVYSYYPCRAYDADGKNNAVTGTAPDIYIEQTSDSFKAQRKMEDEGIDFRLYENRLEWDNVLLETIDMIRSNDKQ